MSSKSAKNKAEAAASSSGGSRRTAIVAAIIAVVVAAGVIAVIASGGDDKKTASNSPDVQLAGVADTKKMLDGIQQQGETLGDPKAPVTLYEFIDYQCPFCRQFRLGTYPKVVAENVK